MKGDILIIDENHRKAGREVVKLIKEKIHDHPQKFIMTVAGESGAGKSETARAIADELEKGNFPCFIFGQDDYFKLPPKTNAARRAQDISWVGMQEVRLDLLDQQLKDLLEGKMQLTKPLVDFDADKIGEETVDLTPYRVIIAEGTYTTTLKHVDCKVFINRNKIDTIESRKKRNREKQDDFLDKILTIEHEIISRHRDLADIVISKNWDIEKSNF